MNTQFMAYLEIDYNTGKYMYFTIIHSLIHVVVHQSLNYGIHVLQAWCTAKLTNKAFGLNVWVYVSF